MPMGGGCGRKGTMGSGNLCYFFFWTPIEKKNKSFLGSVGPAAELLSCPADVLSRAGFVRVFVTPSASSASCSHQWMNLSFHGVLDG